MIEKMIRQALSENLNWYERILVKMFRQTFVKIFHNTRITIINATLR